MAPTPQTAPMALRLGLGGEEAARDQERVGVQLASEEVANHVPAVDRPARLQDVLPVPRPDLRREEVVAFLEDSEHVCRKHLAPEVPVVPRVVPSHDVSERRGAVPARGVWDERDRLAQLRPHFATVHPPFGGVDEKVELPEENLAERHEAGVEVFRGNHALQQRFRKRLRRVLPMPRKLPQGIRLPAPVFEHLGRGFDEVALRRRASEVGEAGGGAELVHHVPELVVERHHLSVLEERWLVLRRTREVRDHGSNAALPRPPLLRHCRRLQVTPNLEAEDGGVAVLALARVQVQEEEPHEGLGLGVVHLVLLYVRMPHFRVLHLGEFEGEDGLVSLEERLLDHVQREVQLHLILVDLVLALLQEGVVVVEVPRVDLPVARLPPLLLLFVLELHQARNLLRGWLLQPGEQLDPHVLDSRRLLRHPYLKNVRGMRLEAEEGSKLLPHLQRVLQQRRVRFLALRPPKAIQGLAGALARTLLHRGQEVGVLERHVLLPVLGVVQSFDEVLAHALQLLR
mmetsp:Transcript_54754/g.130034  ORF Transcript_54754/g.130034 Transcript_54754/m.130034 type:complete len:514 (-) Transcript_54754:570-2111(-)